MSVVEKFYRDLGLFVIDIVDWRLCETGITALWGPSGAGKSTIINGLFGFDPQAEVRWIFKGEDLAQLLPRERRLGVVSQDPALFPHMTVKENILFPVNKKQQPDWKQDFEFLVEELEIAPILNSTASRLSGGEQQRVALARAFIYRPQMLLLDEPFSSLDDGVRGRVRRMVSTLSKRFDCPGLLVTHDRHDVFELADQVTEIAHGNIVRQGSIDAFKSWLEPSPKA